MFWYTPLLYIYIYTYTYTYTQCLDVLWYAQLVLFNESSILYVVYLFIKGPIRGDHLTAYRRDFRLVRLAVDTVFHDESESAVRIHPLLHTEQTRQ